MNALERAKNLLERSRNIWIAPSADSQADGLAGSLALFFTLKKLGKNVNIFTKRIPKRFRFLVNPDNNGEFVISINTSEAEIKKMRYQKEGKDLKIYLALNNGELSKEMVTFPEQIVQPQIKNPDLLIVVGAESLESLGNFFSKYCPVFDKTPVLNMDNQVHNEGFGEVNLIEPASSLAEIAVDLIEKFGSEKELIDQNVATVLLTGIIWRYQNFRDPRTRPKTLETAARLIEKRGNHQKIIQHLYKQKNISQIKLLGKALEKINFNKNKDLYVISLAEKDFKEAGASSSDLSFVFEELKLNFRYLSNLLILWESHASPPAVKGIFYSTKQGPAEKILENFEGVSKRNGALFLIREKELETAEEKILKIL